MSLRSARGWEAKLADERVDKGRWGVLVVDAAAGQTLYELNARRYFTPISNTKLYTTILAFASLRPDFRRCTTVETSGRIDSTAASPATCSSSAAATPISQTENCLTPCHTSRSSSSAISGNR